MPSAPQGLFDLRLDFVRHQFHRAAGEAVRRQVSNCLRVAGDTWAYAEHEPTLHQVVDLGDLYRRNRRVVIGQRKHASTTRNSGPISRMRTPFALRAFLVSLSLRTIQWQIYLILEAEAVGRNSKNLKCNRLYMVHAPDKRLTCNSYGRCSAGHRSC